MNSRRPMLLLGCLLAAVLAAQVAIYRQGSAPDAAGDADPVGTRNEIRALAQGMAQTQKRLDRIEELAARTASLVADLKELSEARPAPATQPTSSATRPRAPGEAEAESDSVSDPASPEEGAGGIPEVLARLKKMEQKLAVRGDGNQWKPSLAEMTEELTLEPSQESVVAQAANAAKDRMMELARIRREDGGSFLDDLADATHEASTNPLAAQQKYGAIIVRLMVEKIPGREATYFSELMQITNETKQRFQTTLSAEQYSDLERRNLDVFSIQTGYDPFGDYVASRWGKSK